MKEEPAALQSTMLGLWIIVSFVVFVERLSSDYRQAEQSSTAPQEARLYIG